MIQTFKIILIHLCLVFSFSILYGQDLEILKTTDYSNQQKLLIKHEVRKRLGDEANEKEVRDLTLALIPWAMMEGLEPSEFARDIYLFTQTRKAGISFTSVEDLIPVLSKFKGDENDFVLLALAMHESEKAELPLHLRDKFLSGVISKHWEGLRILTGMRILILSRFEKKNSEEMLDSILKGLSLPQNSKNKDQLLTAYRELTLDFQSKKASEAKAKIETDLQALQGKEKTKIAKQVLISKRNLGEEFSSFGALEIKERPKLEWSLEDLQGPGPGETVESSDWRMLSAKAMKETVKGWIGTRYVYGASSKAGTDCSGFTRSVLTDKGIAVPNQMVPRSARDQAKIGSATSKSQLALGDLVFFSASPNQSKITHVGLSMGEGNFVHASSSKGVIIQSLNEKWWTDRFTSARRIFVKVGK